ncbi:hypothetical protein QVZ43_02705 [Marinobacter sp. chi1]|uniref:Uncharacterized protein n=1 Tax=Marinobacter suaedae TaxID=3057675 RepID=A0ABT8VXG4_9GAMM|nr:hypothetical protein [Marinobacter sp. chi1]MDO3720615.1 hypothetical protein [Marinobacter sp. chi1]
MMTSPESAPSPWISFLAHLFLILVAWTLFIKYLFPMGFAWATGEVWSTYIYWDLWPLAHLWLAWSLLRQPRYTRVLAIGMSVVEILIIVTLFTRFLADPEWSIWRTNWFVNKVFVLAAFALVLCTALWRPKILKGRSD